ncbi:MAG: M13 family metallopeptidase [Clostridiales bacterium]|nr:M13 family metallopeptidase [Clostridiales bacterium]
MGRNRDGVWSADSGSGFAGRAGAGRAGAGNGFAGMASVGRAGAGRAGAGRAGAGRAVAGRAGAYEGIRCKYMAVALCVIMLLAVIGAPVQAAPSLKQAALPMQIASPILIIETATRGQVSAFLLEQAQKYRSSMTMGDIIRGYGDGDMREERKVTRVEALVMLSRAFGQLPAPIGGLEIMAPATVRFNDTPDWAFADVENIVNARILTEARPMQELISMAEIQLLVQRVHTLFGLRYGDDFYQAVNKAYMDGVELLPGYGAEDRFSELARKTDKDVLEIVNDIVSGSNVKGAPGQKIADMLHNYLDAEARDKEGLKPLKPYLEALHTAPSLARLAAVGERITAELAYDVFAGFGTTADPADRSRKIMHFNTFSPSQPAYFYEIPAYSQMVLEYYEALLTLAGFDETVAERAARNAFWLEKELTGYKMAPQDYYDPDKFYHVHTLDQVKSIVPHLDLEKILQATGYRAPDRVLVMDQMLCEAFGGICVEENREILADAAIVRLLCDLGPMLGTDVEQVLITFQQNVYGIDGSLPAEQRAFQIAKEIFGDYLAPIYVEKHFTKEAKADVERMCGELIAVFKKRIQDLDWMSLSAKERAVKKLENMSVNIGYPEKYDTEALDLAVIDSVGEGGSYYANVLSVRKAYQDKSARDQFLPPDMKIWPLQPFTVNAYYYLVENSINFPAAILQPPFYQVGAAKEANMGSIGIIIAHEITHAFDNNGAKFDEDGKLGDWWEAEDYTAFADRLGDVVRAYDGYEAAPGYAVNGAMTLSENVADLGGIAAALSVIRATGFPDYDAFFTSFAVSWGGAWTRNVMEYLAMNDVHSFNKARVNVGFGQFREFYSTYGIAEGDALYVAPELRAGVW